jgi:hypothetical protein
MRIYSAAMVEVSWTACDISLGRAREWGADFHRVIGHFVTRLSPHPLELSGFANPSKLNRAISAPRWRSQSEPIELTVHRRVREFC